MFEFVELFRINFAKHCAPGKNNAIPRAPGYGRLNKLCGALDFELLHRNDIYSYSNRRDVADALRKAISGWANNRLHEDT